jgi:hypothetical protein
VESRTKIIITTVVGLVIGLPLLFYIMLAMSFGSTAGDYFKISSVSIVLLEGEDCNDSTGCVGLNPADTIDPQKHNAFFLWFDQDYYSQRLNYGSSLMAAIEPGLEGCKEKIQSLSLKLVDSKTKQETDISQFVFMPAQMHAEMYSSEHPTKKARVNFGKKEREILFFTDFNDFKNQFNYNSYDVHHCGLHQDPVLFYIKPEAFSKTNSSFLMVFTVLMSDGKLVSDTISASASPGHEQKTEGNLLNNLFVLSDVEKILGEPAHLTDSSSTNKENISRYYSAYFANEKDSKSGKTGAIYFLVEEYPELSAAQKRYSFIKNANKKNGIKELQNLGDEAYFHSDQENFYFVMVRKGKIVYNMKVNKITSKTSLEQFNLVARKITGLL